MKQLLLAGAFASAVAIAACSSGGGGSSNGAPVLPVSGSAVPTAGPLSGTRGTISLVIPTAKSSSASVRRAQFVSSAALSAVVTVNGGVNASYDISGTSTYCTPVSGGRACTLPISVPLGTTSATVSLQLWDHAGGTGTMLGSGSGNTTIANNATSFTVAVDVSPVVAGVTLSLLFPSTGLPRISISHVQTGTNAGVMTMTFTDPDGVVIPSTSTSPFLVPVTLNVADPSGTVSLTQTTITNATQSTTVSYTGGSTLGSSVTFNALTGTTPVGTLVSKTSGYQTNFYLGLTGTSFSKQPDEITVGSDGNLWFAESHNWAIGKMDTSGNLLGEFNVPNAGSSPGPLAITAGPVSDPHVWYTEPFENGGGLGDYSNVAVPSGVAPGSAFFTGNANSQPVGIRSLGSNIWMSLQGTSQLFIFDTTGAQVAGSPVALAGGTGPNGLAVGSDGNMYVTGYFTNNILAFSPTAPFTQVVNKTIPTAGSSPIELDSGPDGAIWFTEQIGGKIGRLPIGGSIAEVALPANYGDPWEIVNGSDGGIWFTAYNNVTNFGQIIRIDPATHAFVAYQLQTTPQTSYGLVSGPDGNLWATDFVGSSIIRIQP